MSVEVEEVGTMIVHLESVDNNFIDPYIIREAAASVLIYFRDHLEIEEIPLGEFTSALIYVLDKMGYQTRVVQKPRGKRKSRQWKFKPFRLSHANQNPTAKSARASAPGGFLSNKKVTKFFVT